MSWVHTTPLLITYTYSYCTSHEHNKGPCLSTRRRDTMEVSSTAVSTVDRCLLLVEELYIL